MVKRIIFFIASIVLVAVATVEFRTPEVGVQTEDGLSSPPGEAEPALNMEALSQQESFSETSSPQSSRSIEIVPVVAKKVLSQPVSRALCRKSSLNIPRTICSKTPANKSYFEVVVV